MGERKKRKFSNPLSSERGCYSGTAPVNLATLRWMDKNEGGKQQKRRKRNRIEKEKEGGKRERNETIVIALLNKRQGDTWREHEESMETGLIPLIGLPWHVRPRDKWQGILKLYLSSYSTTWFVCWSHCWYCSGNHHWTSVDCRLACSLLWRTYNRYVSGHVRKFISGSVG